MRAPCWWISSVGLSAAIALSSLAAAEVNRAGAPPLDRLGAARSRLEATRARADEVLARIQQLDDDRARQKVRLTTDGRALYRLSRSGLLPLTTGLEGLLGHASRVERLGRVVRTDLAQLTEFEQELTKLRAEQASLSRDLDAQRREIGDLERAQAALIQQQIEQNLRSAGLSLPARVPVIGASSHMSYGLSVVGSRGSEPRRFVDQRGALALPVSGPSSIQEAQRAESGGPGLEFNAQRGAAVRAAAEGRVAFADRYGSYGHLVILDHKDRYYTVYGGFASVEVQVGDEVSKSARLGNAGTNPIYFEVRRGTKTEDARPWLGL